MRLLNKFKLFPVINLSLLSLVSYMLITLVVTGCESTRRPLVLNDISEQKIKAIYENAWVIPPPQKKIAFTSRIFL